VTSFSEALKSALASRDSELDRFGSLNSPVLVLTLAADIDLPANLDKPIEDTGQLCVYLC
jgi:hypothetical protein